MDIQLNTKHRLTKDHKIGKKGIIFNIKNFYLDKYLELKGYFKWNKQELRYEINILNNDTYIKLYYNSSIMSNFETIGNIYQNQKLLNV